MKQVCRQARAEGRLVGFVPTMGALHAGHLSLIEAARRDASPVVVSIFVNPKQFGPNEDYAKYPRDPEDDRRLLEQAGVDFLFAPTVEEMYPAGFRTSVNVEGLGDRLEGKIRPGHFRGVATVVLKLLEIVAPRFAYFGRKDAQQARIIRQMALDLALDSEIVVCPIVREPDGLALSSRNRYLSPAERNAATVLYRALSRARRAIEEGERDTLRIVAATRQELAAEPLASVDYVEIVDADSFEPVVRLTRSCLVLLAVRFGATRLIDNMQVEMDSRRRSDLHRSCEARLQTHLWRSHRSCFTASQDFGRMALGRRFVPNFGDAAVGTDQERGAHDAQKRFAQELLHAPRAVGFDGLEFGIAQQRKVQIIFGGEFGLRSRRYRRCSRG